MNLNDHKNVVNELKLFFPCEDVQDALLNLGLKKTTEPAIITDVVGWHRSGGETFCSYFSLDSSEFSNPERFVLKACCPISLDIPKVLEKWMLRREFMKASGINTPALYARGKGIILEKYVPYSIQEAAELNSYSADFASKIHSVFNKLGNLGYNPIAVCHNLRSFGEDVVNVDFGADIGEASYPPVSLEDLYVREVRNLGFDI